MKQLIWNELDGNDKKSYLARPISKIENLKTNVQDIIDTVKQEGDAALRQYTKRFDHTDLLNLKVSKNELDTAKKNIEQSVIEAYELAMQRIKEYHEIQIQDETIYEKDGVTCRREKRAIESVGLYIPGGSAPLISSLMMLAIPAKIAGCKNIIICTPCSQEGFINPNLLACASLLNIDTVYKIGGAQAIAAMAYGTETVPKVDKIFGPGNAWVTMAKRLCSDDPLGAAQDLPAGPSEVLIIADDSADAEFIAWDLLSQSEHGPDSQSILISNSQKILTDVFKIIKRVIPSLNRKAIVLESLKNCRLIRVETLNEAIEISNIYAPEHLILQINEAESYVSKINSAGSVFLGAWTPESLGDYITGSNHVLPTYGYAKAYSGLNLNDFMKTISIQSASVFGLQSLGPAAGKLASLEGLTAHQQAVNIRLQRLQNND